MGATFSRLKNWIVETLNYADLNAEIDNILNNLGPAGVDDYSVTTTQMRLDTDAGEVGTESQATSLAGELERIRFAIREIKGTGVTYWYETADTSLTEIAAALGNTLIQNRIVSGRMRASSSQPIFLVPNGAARTIKLDGTPTNFVYYVEGQQYTISTDVTATSLTAAPSSNNTCAVNMPGVSGQFWTKMLGECGSVITVDAMGTEISNLIGKLAAFKVGSTEYFIARVDSSTQLSNARRGYFFDSSDAPIPRLAISDNDTITLMKLSWVYATTGGVLQVGYTNPYVQADEPSSPASGDYWFDTSANKWKLYNLATTWVDADATLVGVCVQDTSNTVGARSFDFFKSYDAKNTASLVRNSATEVISNNNDAEVNVYGSTILFNPARLSWLSTASFDSGVTEAASTMYYLYLTESGDTVISDLCPYDRSADLKGLYHPYHAWRCLGSVYNNGSSDFVAVISYDDTRSDNFKVTTQVGSSALTVLFHANPLSRIKLNAYNTTDVATHVRIPGAISFVAASGSTLGHSSGVQATLWGYIVSGSGTPYLALSSALHGDGAAVTTTAEAGNGDSGVLLYAVSALSLVPGRLLFSMYSSQATAGTWASVPTDLAMHPDRAPLVKMTVYTSGSGTHTTTLGTKALRFRMVGAGGGAGSAGAGAGGGASVGGTTTFGGWTAVGGGGGSGNASADAGAQGGGGGTGGSGTAKVRIAGGGGGAGLGLNTSATFAIQGTGGGTAFSGGTNASAGLSSSVAGTNGAANSGQGGGGAIGSNNSGASGGGGGEYVEHVIDSPAATYSYAVGAGGNPEAGAVSGGTGGSGIIIVEEYF